MGSIGSGIINDTNIRVALVASFLPPYRISLYNQIHANPAVDLEVMLCSIKEKDRSWNLELERINFPYTVYKGLNIPIRFSPSRSDYYHIHFNSGILARLIQRRYDAVILSEYSPLTHQATFWLLKLKKTPVILWYRSHSSSYAMIRRIMTPYIDMIINHSEALLVPGDKSKKYLQDRGANPENIFSVGNTIDNQWYTQSYRHHLQEGRSHLRKKLKFDGHKVLLFVGRLIDMKGIFDLLDAYSIIKKQLENAILIIVGDGYLEEELKKYCHKKNISSVRFEGFVQPSVLGQYYLSADVFVLPSHYEAWGLVLNEAMIYGLPVVTTSSVGAAGEIVLHNETGFIVPSGDPNTFADAVVKILTDTSLAKSMSENAQAIIDKHTPSHSANKIVEAIIHAAKTGK